MNKPVYLTVLQFLLSAGCVSNQPVSKDVVSYEIPSRGGSVICQYENGRLRVLDFLDGKAQPLARIQLRGEFETTNAVAITDKDGELLAETAFNGIEETSGRTSPSVRFSQDFEFDATGKKDHRQWWYKEEYLLFRETLSFDQKGRLVDVLIKGPHGIEVKRAMSSCQ